MELKDRVQQISTVVEELRQAAGDGRKSRELIDSLFRTVHSFKAAASAAGRHDASAAAHQFENFIQAIRTGDLPLNNDVRQFLKESAAGLLDGSASATFDSFNVIEVDRATNQVLLPPELATLREEEQQRAAAAIQEGANIYTMEVAFDFGDFEERFRELKHRLEEVAEFISTSATLQDDKIVFQVVYASKSEQVPVRTIVRQISVAGKSVAANLNKQVEFSVRVEECLLDRHSSDVVADALLHLVRNAIDHGIESDGTVILEVITTAEETQITVTDNGRGIAPENLPLLFQPGFTTAREVTEFSGRGVGLDAVKTAVEQLDGSVNVTSEPGKGSSFKITIPNPSLGA